MAMDEDMRDGRPCRRSETDEIRPQRFPLPPLAGLHPHNLEVTWMCPAVSSSASGALSNIVLLGKWEINIFFKFFKKWKESDDAGCFSSGGNGRQVAPFTCHMIRSHTLHMPVRYICQDYHLWEHIFHLKANNELVSGKVPPGGLATKNKFPPKLLYRTNLDVSLKLLVVNSWKLAGMFFITVSLTGKNCKSTV